MTFADDFAPIEGEELEPQSPWPAAFGVTFTPRVGGILLGVLGLAGAAALGYYVVLPAWNALTELQLSRDQQAQERDSLLATIQRRAALEQEAQQAQVRRQQVLSLFADEAALDTLLLDLNRQVEARDSAIRRYDPVIAAVEPIQDGSWGPEVNGLLKNKRFAMEVTGTFDQLLNVLRSFEQLQLVLSVEDVNLAATGTQALRFEQGQLVASEPPELQAQFNVEVLLPVSAEELAELAAQQAAPPAPEGTVEGAEGQPAQ